MKKKTWERRFLRTLKPLRKEERYSALAYYQELYDDKAEIIGIVFSGLSCSSPFLFLVSGSAVIMANVGIGVTAIRVGLLLFVAFYSACKWTAIATYRRFSLIFYRRIQ